LRRVSLDALHPAVENRPTAGMRVLGLRELWGYRELIFFLALRDVKARYKQAVFGIGWALIRPLAGVAVFTVVFRQLANVPSEGLPYIVFALLGLLVWTYFSSTLNDATTSLVSNASLVTKVYFPRLAAPLAALLPGLIDLVLGLVLLGVLMAYFGITPGPALVALPLCLLAVMVVALGAGLLLATLNVRYRDVGAIIGLLTQLWLLASPVAYPSSLVGSDWRWLYAVNPMTGVIDLFRWAILGTATPGPEVLVSFAVGLALLAGGLVYFLRTERQFADVI
jgi:lipopolysaccharide transport system permease protein